MGKRVIKVEFVGDIFPIPIVTFEDGEKRRIVKLPVGEGEKVQVANTRQFGDRSISSPSTTRLQTPKLPQPNIKPFQDFVREFSQNIASALQGIIPTIPQQQNVYYHEETKPELIRRMQMDKQLYPTCPSSNSVMSICSNCDRKDICNGLREQEAKRQKELDEKYGVRYR